MTLKLSDSYRKIKDIENIRERPLDYLKAILELTNETEEEWIKNRKIITKIKEINQRYHQGNSSGDRKPLLYSGLIIESKRTKRKVKYTSFNPDKFKELYQIFKKTDKFYSFLDSPYYKKNSEEYEKEFFKLFLSRNTFNNTHLGRSYIKLFPNLFNKYLSDKNKLLKEVYDKKEILKQTFNSSNEFLFIYFTMLEEYYKFKSCKEIIYKKNRENLDKEFRSNLKFLSGAIKSLLKTSFLLDLQKNPDKYKEIIQEVKKSKK